MVKRMEAVRLKESRLFKIVYFILEHGATTAAELAEKFEVSVRTIYRDMDVISSAGIPVYVTAGRNGGIRIAEHYALDRVLFSDGEKQDILAALQSVALVNGSYQKEMLTKLSALFNVASDNWFELDFSRWGSKGQDNSTFELVKNAVISHRLLCIVYVNSRGQKQSRKIQPLKMMYKAKEWYVKAYCADQAAFRLFKLNRIISLELLPEFFTPIEYPPQEAIPQKSFRRITLLFPKEMAYRIYDDFEASQIAEQPDGKYIVSAEMPEDAWLTGYLLSFGAQVEVIEPACLKKILAEEAQKIYEKNKT